MLDEDVAVRLEAIDQRGKSNTHRLDILEGNMTALNKLATAVEVMATKQDAMADTLNRLDGKVETLEGKPGKRWDSLVEKVLLVLAGAFAAWLAAGAPGV